MRLLLLAPSLHCAVVCAAVLLCVPCWAQSLRTIPPPGFDDLDDPQRTLIDLVILGRTIQGVAVALQGATLRFEEPLRLLAEIKEIDDSQQLLQTLSGPLPTNEQLVCHAHAADQENCGRLEPRVAGIIYDRERFRAELFINAAFVRSEVGVDIFLPSPPTEEFAFSQLFGSASGSMDGTTRISLHQELQVGAGATRLVASTFLSNEEALLIDALRLEHDRKLWRYTLGRFFAPSLAAISDLNMLGISIRTHTDGLVDKKLTDPDQLAVFLNRRAQVRVLREGRVLLSQTLAPGHQTVDQQRLPDGSYQVTLQILEEGSAPREEVRFFVKEYDVPSARTPFYFFDAGRIVNFTRSRLDADDPMYALRVGARWRVANNLALGGDLLGGTQAQLAEFSASRLGEHWSARWASFASNFGNFGIDSRLTAHTGQWHPSLMLRKVWSGDGASADSFIYELARSQTRASISLAGPIGEAILSSSFSLSDSQFGRSHSASMHLRYPCSLNGALNSDILFDIGYADGTVVASLGLTGRFGRPSRTLDVTSGYRIIDGRRSAGPTDHSGDFQTASLSGYFEPSGAHRIQAMMAADRTPDGHNLQVQGDYQGGLGQLSAASNVGRLGNISTASYDVNFQTGLYATRLLSTDRAFGMGGSSGNAAILVGIEGSAPDNIFHVYIDGVERGALRAQEQLTVTVPAYHTYDIRISATGTRAVTYDQGARHVTLFPGNVAHYTWRAAVVIPAFGRIIGSDGEPLRNVQIKGAAITVFTDERGYFTAELPVTATLRFLHPRAGCEIPVTIDDPSALFVRLGILRCSGAGLAPQKTTLDHSNRITRP
ncbi:hypothetical protein ACG33_07375 [Steroidobacter denitrificans]|uniref:Pilus assembly protein PapC n=1 Tax=Steroidobacter denitrificans TaxID=465721 RepID=A0A127FBD8_STEDE|nr:TcfC E-set like domain-containing protein [Steroidobacter denitrificans]AMN46918.1 hypothetical protein ACG33_07375 [Steroidobacter denitrificans]